jgi:hypothetical protein
MIGSNIMNKHLEITIAEDGDWQTLVTLVRFYKYSYFKKVLPNRLKDIHKVDPWENMTPLQAARTFGLKRQEKLLIKYGAKR